MSGFLYAFGIGVSFAVGIYTGIALCMFSTKKSRDLFAAEMRADRQAIEERLAEQCSHVGQIVVSLNNLYEMKVQDRG